MISGAILLAGSRLASALALANSASTAESAWLALAADRRCLRILVAEQRTDPLPGLFELLPVVARRCIVDGDLTLQIPVFFSRAETWRTSPLRSSARSRMTGLPAGSLPGGRRHGTRRS